MNIILYNTFYIKNNIYVTYFRVEGLVVLVLLISRNMKMQKWPKKNVQEWKLMVAELELTFQSLNVLIHQLLAFIWADQRNYYFNILKNYNLTYNYFFNL